VLGLGSRHETGKRAERWNFFQLRLGLWTSKSLVVERWLFKTGLQRSKIDVIVNPEGGLEKALECRNAQCQFRVLRFYLRFAVFDIHALELFLFAGSLSFRLALGTFVLTLKSSFFAFLRFALPFRFALKVC
jgi:hypothetical protein